MSNPPSTSLPNSPGWSRVIERLRAATAGRFSIIRELGRGGFAAVFLAQQAQPNRLVAIKLLLPSHLESTWALEHFRSESQKISSWRHQSVVTIYEVHEVGDLFFFVMNYVEGGSLHELLAALGPLTVPMTRSVLAQVGSALQYAHRQGVTHRDIKPQNVLMDTDGGAVVTDFGISKQSGGTSHTVSGMIVGTAPYMAPEQCEEGTTSFQSDQYALGIVAYEMLTGAPPFTGSPTSVLLAHMKSEVPPLRLKRPDCPPELDAAISRMLQKNPRDRFSTIGDAIVAAGAQELSELHPDRVQVAQATRRLGTDGRTTALEIMTIPPVLEVGEHIPIRASARSEHGEPLPDAVIAWSSANSAVARVDAAGEHLVALEPGFTTLVVQAGRVKQEIQLSVRAPQATTVRVFAPVNTLKVGDSAQFTANGTSRSGQRVPSAARWSSSHPEVADVNANGEVRAVSAGRARIRAQMDDASDESVLEVYASAALEPRLPVAPRTREVETSRAPRAATVELVVPAGGVYVGDRVQVYARVRSANGDVLERVVSWLSDDPSLARVDPVGALMALAPGTVVVSASVDDTSGAAIVEIMARKSALAALSAALFASTARKVASGMAALALLATVAVYALRAPSADSVTPPIVPPAPQPQPQPAPPTPNPGPVPTPDPGLPLPGPSPGADTLKRRKKPDSTKVPEPPRPKRSTASRLDLSLASSSLATAQTTTYRVQGVARGAPIDAERIRVMARDESVASVSDGTIVARKPGTTWIVASAGVQFDSVSLTVTAPAVAGPVVTALRVQRIAALLKGDSRSLSVEAILRNGNRLADFSSVSVVSDNPAVVGVISSPAGFKLEGKTPGRAKIRVSAGVAPPVEFEITVLATSR